MNALLHFVRINLLMVLAIGIVLFVVPSSIVYAQWYGPGDERNGDCSGSLASCDSDGSSSTEGQTCYSAYNSCGSRNTGVIYGGTCSVRVQTGTDGKGNPTYTYYAITVPANPANYGNACQSASNACGVKNTGTIQCNGTCSVSAAPALPAGYGTSCQSAANACGETDTGTIQCNSACSVSTAPASPANYGATCQSEANACGVQNTGSIQCDGQCSVSTETPALPDGYGESCQSAANSCGMRNTGVVQCSGQCSASAPAESLCAIDAEISIKATPRLVQKGNATNVTWSTTDASSCTVVGTNGDSWSGLSGTRQTAAIDDRTTYSISCVGINTEVITDLVIVDLVPVFQEL